MQAQPRSEFRAPYEEWMEQEGIPIYEAVAGTGDVTTLPRKPWARTGGLGTFVQMLGPRQAERGVYVCEIPGGKALEPEKHLYQEAIVILKGRGLTEIWQEGSPKRSFEWAEGSLFAPPLNTWHHLINGSREPAIFLAFTSAPQVMNAFGPHDFIFNCDYKFLDQYDGREGYFTSRNNKIKEGRFATIWYTNFIPDVNAAVLDDLEHKVAGGQLTGYRMAGGFPNGHISAWPPGRYHKAHYHGPGTILCGLEGEGYVLVWPRNLGTHPYERGNGDKVLRIKWEPRSIYSPPDGWFHQHFNTGAGPARHVAIYPGGSPKPGYSSRVEEDYSGGLADPLYSAEIGGEISGYVSVREGGTLIDYEDEDPQIRNDFAQEIARKGIPLQMPLV
jgi:quercetin dioxygenase-like cupin family protein